MDPSEQRLADLSLLYQLVSSFSALLDLKQLLLRILTASLQLLKARDAQAILTDAETGQLTLYSANRQGWLGEPVRVDPGFDPLILHVSQHPMPLLIRPGDSLQFAGLELSAIDARLYVPLTHDQRVLGALVVTRAPEPFSAEDQDLLTALSTHAAIAIENALLFKQSLDRSLELSLLVESADAVSSSLDLSRVLNAVARHLMRALRRTGVSLWDGTGKAAASVNWRNTAQLCGLMPKGRAMRFGLASSPAGRPNCKPAATTWNASEDEAELRRISTR
jgi:GAF domain-containing protein